MCIDLLNDTGLEELLVGIVYSKQRQTCIGQLVEVEGNVSDTEKQLQMCIGLQHVWHSVRAINRAKATQRESADDTQDDSDAHTMYERLSHGRRSSGGLCSCARCTTEHCCALAQIAAACTCAYCLCRGDARNCCNNDKD